MKKQMIGALLVVALLAGCAAHRDRGSFVNDKALEASAAQSVATDATSAIMAQYPPGKTSIRLLSAGSNSFSAALEQLLRKQGYRIVPPDAKVSAALEVAYVLDRKKRDGSLLLRLQFSDASGKRKMMRSYTATGQPEAGFSTIGG